MIEDAHTDQLPQMDAGSNGFTAAEIEHLRECYAELPSAAEAASELLGVSGPIPTGMRFERFMELDGRVVGLILAIEKILHRDQ